MPSENTAGAEQTADDVVTIDSLQELLGAGEPVTETPPDAGAEDSGSDDAAPTKFNDLAGRLGIDTDALYQLEVSQADDGTPVTVENLKDAYAAQKAVTLRELEFEENRTQAEAKILQAQDELRELMAALPENAIAPKALEKLRQTHAERVKLEQAKTLEIIPAWQDETVRTKDVQGMVEHLQQYGYPVDHLNRVSDHRQMKYIRDNYLREKRIRAALDKVKPGRPDPTPTAKLVGRAPSKHPVTGVKQGDARNKLDALFRNL